MTFSESCMHGTDSSLILRTRQVPAQSQLDNVEATLSKCLFQNFMINFLHVIVCLASDKRA